MQRQQQLSHLADHAGRNGADLAVKAAEQKNALLPAALKARRDRCPKHLAEPRDRAGDASNDVIALLRHGLKIVALHLVEMRERQGDLVGIARAGRGAEQRKGAACIGCCALSTSRMRSTSAKRLVILVDTLDPNSAVWPSPCPSSKTSLSATCNSLRSEA